MKGRIIVGALFVSVALAGQGFGFELLNTLLGTNQGSSACCEPQCCEKACPPACCEKACPPVCKPACDPCCEPQCCKPACDPCCEPKCCEPNCCQPCCKPRCDLFGGLKGLFACKKSCGGCCEPCGNACCEPKCCPEPQCCEKSCAPACDPCAPACDPCAPACEPTCGTSCGHKRHCTPVRDLLDDLCSLRICVYKAPKCHTCCGTACCEPNCCEPACGGCGNGGDTAPAVAPKDAEPAKSLPDAPVDASASVRPAKIYRASRSVVRN